MGLFGKKKPDDNKPEKPVEDDDLDDIDLDFFDSIDSQEDLSSSGGIFPGYDDDVNWGFGDDDDEKDNPKKKAPVKKVDKKKSKLPAILGGGVAVFIIAGLLFAPDSSETGSGGNDDGEETEAQSEEDSGGVDDGVVVSEKIGETYTGSDNGNPSTGTGAILAFEHDYYTERDGDKAREHFNPAAPYDGQFIQQAIDKVPKGTEYEVAITPVSIGTHYDVELRLKAPGKEQKAFALDMTTEKEGEKYVIEEFTWDNGKG